MIVADVTRLGHIPDVVLTPIDERHYSVKEVGEILNISHDTVTRLFRAEPGVVRLAPPRRRGKRTKVMLRIPQSVLERVYTRCVIS
jgi:transposase